MNKIVKKIRRAKKAVGGVLTQVGTGIAVFAPQWDDKYKVAVGIVGSIFTGLIIYFSTNEE